MKKVFVPVIALALLISWSPNAHAGKQSIGLSYAEVTQYLSNAIVMRRSTAVYGQPRYLGMTNDKLAIMEIIGVKKNILQASLIIGLPNDSRSVLQRNTVMLLRFMTNIAPDWNGGTHWAAQALDQVTSSSNSTTYIIRGDKRIEITFLKPLAMISLTVKHK